MKSAWILGTSLAFLFTASDANARCVRIWHDGKVETRCDPAEAAKRAAEAAKKAALQGKIKNTVKDRVSDDGRHTTAKPAIRTDRITDTDRGNRRVERPR